MAEERSGEESNPEADSRTGDTEGVEERDSLDGAEQKEEEQGRGSSGVALKRLCRAFGFIILLALLSGSFYYLRSLEIKVLSLESKIDKYGLTLDDSVALLREEGASNMDTIKKSISEHGDESSGSLKKVLIFLGDLRFKIKELENRITEVSENPTDVQVDSGGDAPDETESDDDDDAEEQDSGGEADLSSDAASGVTPLENIINQGQGKVAELDEEFIGEVLDRMLTRRLAEYDLSRKEEELKKRRDERLREQEKNKKIVMAIEDSVKRAVDMGFRALVYCKEKVFSAYEFLTAEKTVNGHE